MAAFNLYAARLPCALLCTTACLPHHLHSQNTTTVPAFYRFPAIRTFCCLYLLLLPACWRPAPVFLYLLPRFAYTLRLPRTPAAAHHFSVPVPAAGYSSVLLLPFSTPGRHVLPFPCLHLPATCPDSWLVSGLPARFTTIAPTAIIPVHTTNTVHATAHTRAS